MLRKFDFSNIPTPFYLYDLDLLRETLSRVKAQSHRRNYKLHYALKANFESEIVSLIKEYGIGADCVSGNEVRLALECGISPQDIMFAGSGKSDAELQYAIQKQIGGINCESAEEFGVIEQLAQECGLRARVLLRLNPDVRPETHKFISTGQRDSKFGISDTELDKIIEMYRSTKMIEIVGLHFHIGSQIRDLTIYTTLCKKVNNYVKYLEDKSIDISIIDLGGGLGINYDDPEGEPITDFEPYFEIFDKGIELRENQQLHFEPGRAIVGQCGTLITKVLYVKEVSSSTAYAIVDAGMTDLLRPALYNAKHKIESLSSQREPIRYTIGGPICESSDILRKNISLPQLTRGDLLAIRTTGAYGSSMSSGYNLRDKAAKRFIADGKLLE